MSDTPLPIKNLRLQSDLDAGGHAITNAVTPVDPTGLVTRAFAGDAANLTTGTVPADRLPAATTSAQGAVELATAAEVQTGSDALRALAPSTLSAWWTWIKSQAQTISAAWTWSGNQTWNGAANTMPNQTAAASASVMTRGLVDARVAPFYSRTYPVTAAGWKTVWMSPWGDGFCGTLAILRDNIPRAAFFFAGGVNYAQAHGATIRQLFAGSYTPGLLIDGIRIGSWAANHCIDVNFNAPGTYTLQWVRLGSPYSYDGIATWFLSAEVSSSMSNVWATLTPRVGAQVATGDLQYGGTLRIPSTASAPADTATPVDWMEIKQGANSYRVPLYQ